MRPRSPRAAGAAAVPVALAAAVLAVLPSVLLPLAGRAQEPIPPDSAAPAPDTPPGGRPRYRNPELRVRVTRTEEALRRVPMAVSVVDARHAEAGERHVSLRESLQGIPGVQVFERGNFSLGDRLVIRGTGSRAQFGVRGIRISVDGIPLTLPDGQAVLTNLDLGSAGRIEVLRGGASSLYGNAAGGVVRVETGGFGRTPLELRPRLLLGAEELRSQALEATGRVGRIEWLARGTHLETEGFREHARAEVWRANLVARTPLRGDGDLRAVLNLFDTPFSENPSSLAAEDAEREPRKVRPAVVAQGAGESATQAQGGLSLERSLGGGLRLRAAVWGLHRDLFNPLPGRIIDLDREAAGVRLQLEGPVEGLPLPLRWTAGLDLSGQRDDRRESENLGVAAPTGGPDAGGSITGGRYGGGPDGGTAVASIGGPVSAAIRAPESPAILGSSRGRARAGAALLDQEEEVGFLGPFLRLEVSPLPSLRLTAGARLDAFRFRAEDRLLADGDDSGTRDMTRVSPSVGVSWSPRPALTLYGNLSTAFETPTASELSNRPGGLQGLDPDLDPQTTRTFEVGARALLAGLLPDTGLLLETALYDARVEDALVPFQSPDEETFFRNAGEISRQGLELRAGIPLPAGLRTELSWAWQDFRFDDFVTDGGDFGGNREPGVPEHRVRAALLHTAPFGLLTEVRLTWTDAFAVNDANTVRNPSSRVVDLRLRLAGGGRGGWRPRPFLGIDNLFDERHNGSVVPNAFADRFFEPAPGRELFGGLELPLPPPLAGGG